jgi:neutral ceramidase
VDADTSSGRDKEELRKELEKREAEMKLKGRYRIKYSGDSKGIGGGITAFEGVSGVFELV